MVTPNGTSVFMLLLTSTSGFNAGRHCNFYPPRSRTSRPPLFFRDIEPEISSFTISPRVNFNNTTIFVRNCEDYSDGQSTVDIDVRRKSTRTKTESERLASPTQPQEHKNAKATSPKSREITWQKHYNELRMYREENGNCLVPQKYVPNPTLGLWVMQQRRKFTLQQSGKRSSLNGPSGEKRAKLLNEIGFVWRVQRRGPRGAYGELRRMKRDADVSTGKSCRDDLSDAVDFEKYMIRKREEYSDKEMRAAWLQRYEIFQ